jgi:hypothetical protein
MPFQAGVVIAKTASPAMTHHGYRIVAAPTTSPQFAERFLLTHFERVGAIMPVAKSGGGMTMADRRGLRLVGFIFATVTVAVMLTAAMVVRGYADGAYALEAAAIEGQ